MGQRLSPGEQSVGRTAPPVGVSSDSPRQTRPSPREHTISIWLSRLHNNRLVVSKGNESAVGRGITGRKTEWFSSERRSRGSHNPRIFAFRPEIFNIFCLIKRFFPSPPFFLYFSFVDLHMEMSFPCLLWSAADGSGSYHEFAKVCAQSRELFYALYLAQRLRSQKKLPRLEIISNRLFKTSKQNTFLFWIRIC